MQPIGKDDLPDRLCFCITNIKYNSLTLLTIYDTIFLDYYKIVT